MSVTRYTLTLIKGTSLEALFSGRWDKSLPRDKYGRVFLDVNPNCFGSMVDYLSKHKITLPDYSLKITFLGGEDDAVLQKLLVAFGLRYDGIEKLRRMHQKTKLVQADDSIKIHNKASEEECKVMNFDTIISLYQFCFLMHSL